ncbi:MAG TPA: phosphoglucosamine mutase [Acidimicrobiales bacterium]
MTPLTFGTDGIRGVANRDLTPELALALGRAAVAVLGPGPWVVGSDTRRSGPMLVAALAAGLASAGADVVDLGVAPTPAVAFHAARTGGPAAIVSASHNPYADNGIKLLGAGGRKLSEAREAAVSENMAAALSAPAAASDAGAGGPAHPPVGTISRAEGPLDAYADHVVAALEGRSLGGLRVVVDCANGAASEVAPAVLRSLGADVTVLAASPDGTNINAGCGSTHPAALQEAVVAAGADAGLALDGDADRVVAAGGDGTLVDGDRIIAVAAADLQRRGRLAGDRVVVTVMSNLGLRQALAGLGIGVVETPVGDRNVLAAMEEAGLVLGGEQSGHVIFRDLATTGDGLLTGVVLLDIVARSGRSLADLAGAAMTALPQVLVNVAVPSPSAAVQAPAVAAVMAEVEAELGGSGRVVLRPSGTEPLVRVMVEAPTETEARSAADRISAAVRRADAPA